MPFFFPILSLLFILSASISGKLSHFLENVNLGKLVLKAIWEQFAELLLFLESLPKMHFIPKRRWKEQGASAVLSLRALRITKGRWEQFWEYIMRHGYGTQHSNGAPIAISVIPCNI